MWLVERTYSDDEQNLIILTYATPDGSREFRKERALTSFTGDHRETRAALEVALDDTARIDDPETRERYAAEAGRTADRYAPTDAV
ncbi:hypothetical protein [Halomarina pelagica]|uniref:hypothetical protein n=1 Tax=Halomarina pelagica TaxID=2961599 RepID=UPI0020C599D4|nr:hypothetical protein [Halomarina sp. BND7]